LAVQAPTGRRQFILPSEPPSPFQGFRGLWPRLPGAGKRRQPQATCRCPFGAGGWDVYKRVGLTAGLYPVASSRLGSGLQNRSPRGGPLPSRGRGKWTKTTCPMGRRVSSKPPTGHQEPCILVA